MRMKYGLPIASSEIKNNLSFGTPLSFAGK
jgi:hypothetical protein